MPPFNEEAFIHHCAPVLMGKKPAALFGMPGAPAAIVREFEAIALPAVRCCALPQNRRALVFVYNPICLQQALQHPLVKGTLVGLGYPRNGTPEAFVAHLLGRLAACHCEDYPHEVGFFLGYPPLDVLGFMASGGKGCKHCGLWKVYDDVPAALALLHAYKECRRCAVAHLAQGGSLHALCCTGISAGYAR